MLLEKHYKAVEEVLDEIESALSDPKGATRHQRRIALMVSLGSAELIEIYLHKLGILKPGSRIKHDWLKGKEMRQRVENQCIKSLDDVKRIDEILKKAMDIELQRNDIAYGAPLDDEVMIKDHINMFFDMKGIIESELGEKIVK